LNLLEGELVTEIVNLPTPANNRASKLDPEARARYITEFARSLSHTKATQAAGVGSRQAWEQLRARDASFAQALIDAEASYDDLVREHVQKAAFGFERVRVAGGKPVYKKIPDPNNPGKFIKVPDLERVHSDAMLALEAKSRKNLGYNPAQEINVNRTDNAGGVVTITQAQFHSLPHDLKLKLADVAKFLKQHETPAELIDITPEDESAKRQAEQPEMEEWERIGRAQEANDGTV